MAININPATTTQVVINLARKNQEKLADVSTQIASGFKHNDYKGFAEDGAVQNLISFSSTVKSTQKFIDTNELTLGRINAQDLAISQLQDISSQISNLIAQRRNSASGGDLPITTEANAILDSISGKLNVRYDGRYLFSGTKTNALPVTNIKSSNLNTDNTANSTYYNGDSNRPVAKADDSLEVTYGVTADEDGFKQLIAAVHLLIEGHNSDDDDVLGEAMTMANSAVDNIALSRAVVVSAKETLTKTNASLQSVNLLISENLNDISNTDIVQATTRMSELQATIQATFLSFTRLNELRLSNFL